MRDFATVPGRMSLAMYRYLLLLVYGIRETSVLSECLPARPAWALREFASPSETGATIVRAFGFQSPGEWSIDSAG